MYNKKLVFVASCLGMLLFGIVMTTLGAILPSIVEKFGIQKDNAGSLFLLMTFGMLFGSLIFGPVVDRFGYKSLLAISALLVFLGLEGIAFATSILVIKIPVFLIGFGGGIINGGTNALVSDISEDTRSAGLSLLGVFFGVGAIGVPLLLWLLLGLLSYEFIIAGIGLLVLVPLILFLVIKFPVPKQEQGFPIKDGVRMLKELPLLLFGVILLFESGMEMTVGSWTPLFFTEELGSDVNKAAFFFSFYWLGMVAMRTFLGFLLKNRSAVGIQFLCIGLAFIGAVILIISNSVLLSILGLFLIGCGLAPTFPVMLGFVGTLYSKLSGTAFSIVFVMALLGGMSYPYITGINAQSFGLRTAFLIIPISLLVMAFVFLYVYRKILFKNK